MSKATFLGESPHVFCESFVTEKPTIVVEYRRAVLTDRQAAALLDAIINEAAHYTLPSDDPRQDNNAAVGYPYPEAQRLAKKTPWHPQRSPIAESKTSQSNVRAS